MKARFLISILTISFSLSIYSQNVPGYRIIAKINGLSDSTIFLAYHLGDKQYIQDTVKLDRNGVGSFTGKEKLQQGIYMVVLPDRRYFEIIVSDKQDFSFECKSADFFNTLKFFNSNENNSFITYQRNWVKIQKKAASIEESYKQYKSNADSVKVLTKRRQENENEMKEYLRSVVDQNQGTLLALLVNAIIPPSQPEIIIAPGTKNPDSVRWVRSYMYNKNHFFDNVPLSDERLVRTPILHAKLKTYFSSVVLQLPDSINKEVDRIILKCYSSRKVFQYVAVFLFNHFRESEIMGHDAIMVKLADDIYLSGKADWVTKEWRENLRKEVDKLRPNLIGVTGHDLVMNSYNNVFVSLHDIRKDFTVLYFWEPDCGHCKEATPKLKEYYDKARNNGVEVFAVCTQADKQKWEKYIIDNKLDWINGWDPQRKTNFDYYYNVTATPLVYILDRNKKIIAKKLPVESIGSFIDNYRKYGGL
jgi:thiol-disulfide isomerase/thioredoxin